MGKPEVTESKQIEKVIILNDDFTTEEVTKGMIFNYQEDEFSIRFINVSEKEINKMLNAIVSNY